MNTKTWTVVGAASLLGAGLLTPGAAAANNLNLMNEAGTFSGISSITPSSNPLVIDSVTSASTATSASTSVSATSDSPLSPASTNSPVEPESAASPVSPASAASPVSAPSPVSVASPASPVSAGSSD